MIDNPSREIKWQCGEEDELSAYEISKIINDIFGRGLPKEDEKFNRTIERINEIGEHYHVSYGDLRYAMNNEIEDSVDIRAKLEQLTEECGELIQASMKLIRALGNGNPTKVSKDEAIAKVLEEWSDVEVAGIYILRMLEGMVDYDIYERIDEIGKFKEQRWIERVRKERENEDYRFDAGCDGDSCDL